MLRGPLLLLVLTLLCSTIAANLLAQKPFTVNPRLTNRKATVQTDKIICDFKFSTASCEELKNGKLKEKPKEEAPKKKTENPSFAEYKQKISGECFSKLQGYWTYKVCLGDSVVQFHDSEQYTLGVYLSSENEQTKDTQIYKDGTECVVGDRRFKRKSNLKLMCGSSSALVNIQETETCVYSVLVVHPQLCGEGSPFETYSGAIEAPPVVTKRITDEDHWFLAIEKTDDESYICTVKNVLRDIKEEPTTCFTNFSLEFYHEDDQAAKEENEDAANESIKDKKLKSVVVRKDKRKYPSRQELIVDPKTHSVRNSKSFDGSLEYARIVLQ